MRHPMEGPENLIAWAGMSMRKEPKVEAIFTSSPVSAPKLDPPSTDLATRIVWPPASGQKQNTSPKELVLMSPPSALLVVSLPLMICGVPHVPLGPLRKSTRLNSSH